MGFTGERILVFVVWSALPFVTGALATAAVLSRIPVVRRALMLDLLLPR